MLTRTVTGLRIYAIGGDARAAELCGVPVGRTIVGLYAVNGLLIGIVSVLIAGRLGSITPTIGVRFELDVLTAAILGGVAFTGGAGRPLGIAIGVATIGILNAGLIFVGLQSWWQSIGDRQHAAPGAGRRPDRQRTSRPAHEDGADNWQRREPVACVGATKHGSGFGNVGSERRAGSASGLFDQRRQQVLRRAHGTRGSLLHRRQGRDRLPSRRQRRGQEHAGKDHLRRHSARRRSDAARGHAGAVSAARRMRVPPDSKRFTRISLSVRTSASRTT